MIGEVLAGRFRIERLLGRGGTSAVWLARDLELDRLVAVKILHARRLESQEAVERFEREARTLASLAHPGIVTVIDRGEHDDRPFIVFEYVRGQDLRTRIAAEGRLEPAVALAVAVQVADALAYAHDHGVIHRDVKPHNVLLTDEGVAKLTDFGIARLLDDPGMTRTGRVLGTGEYLAPEQATGQKLDARADVYALGAMLYHCLAGEPPYQGDGFVELAEKHVRAPVPSVRAARPTLSPGLDEIVQRALQKLPDDRYPDCRALRRDLERELRASADAGLEDTAEIPVVSAAVALREPTPAHAPRPLPLAHPLPAAAAPQPLPAAAVPAPPLPQGRSRAAYVGLLAVIILAAGGWAAYLVDGREGSGTTEGTAAAPGTRQPPATEPVQSTGRPRPALAALTNLVASTYDPAGDGTENPQSAANAVDGNPATSWSTEHYRGSPDANHKGGVGLVLDAGGPVHATRLRLVTTEPGWKARIYLTDHAAIPPQLSGWTAASAPFSVSGTTTSVTLRPRLARYFLVWITELTGPTGSWSASIAEVRLLGPRQEAGP